MTATLWKTKTQRDHERALKREAVLRTAARAFSEQGFHRTSLDDVAERLNVTKPTLYHYVRSKDEILFECVSIGLERLDAAASLAEGRRSGGSGLERLIVLWTEYAHIVTEDFGRCLILVGEDPLPVEARKDLRALKGKIDKRFRALIEDGVGDGSIIPCDPKLLAFAAAGALSWIARWHDPSGPLAIDSIARQTIGFFVNGIGAGNRADSLLPSAVPVE